MVFVTQRVLLLVAAVSCFGLSALAQSLAPRPADINATAASKDVPAKETEIEDIRRQLREQREQIDRLNKALAEQVQIVNGMRARRDGKSSGDSVSTTAPSTTHVQQDNTVEARISKLETETKKTSDSLSRQLGSISFSGELRIEYDSFYGQLNALPNGNDSAIVGNPLSTRQRGRLRARFALGGQFGNDVLMGSFDQTGQPRKGKEFDWGLRISSGSLANVVSSNQVLTDFYNRKPFGLDRAFVGWRPRSTPGLRLQAGKFDTPWTHTELTIDNDLQPEGVSETYTRGFRHPTLKNISLVAWQLPFLERNSAFILNTNGTVNFNESRRAG